MTTMMVMLTKNSPQKVTLAPGEMVWYESARLSHGRFVLCQTNHEKTNHIIGAWYVCITVRMLHFLGNFFAKNN